jgi:transposase-like protein
MKFPRFSGHLLITLRRLQCTNIPNLKRHGFYPVDFKIQAVQLGLRDDVLSKDVAQALDIPPFMLSRWRKEYREGKFSIKPRYTSNNERISINKLHG